MSMRVEQTGARSAMGRRGRAGERWLYGAAVVLTGCVLVAPVRQALAG